MAFALLTGYGLTLVVTALSKLNRPYGQAAAGVALVTVGLLAFTSFASYLNLYHSEYPKLSAGYWGLAVGAQGDHQVLSVGGDRVRPAHHGRRVQTPRMSSFGSTPPRDVASA